MRKICSVAQCDSLQTQFCSYFLLLSLSLSLSLLFSSLPSLLTIFFVAFADTHVFSSCLPIENRVGDQIEFPTSTSFYSLRAGRSRVAEEKNLTGFSAFEMRAFEKAITKYNIMNRSSAYIMVTSLMFLYAMMLHLD